MASFGNKYKAKLTTKKKKEEALSWWRDREWLLILWDEILRPDPVGDHQRIRKLDRNSSERLGRRREEEE